MTFTNFYKGVKTMKSFVHMNFDQAFAWDTKYDRNDKDNRYNCKKSV